MNAVLDSTPATPASKAFDQITQHLVKLSEASAGCHHVLTQSQSLRKWTSERLREQLNQIRLQTGLTTTNPDAIFFTVPDESGSLVSKGMTDLLIDTRRGKTPLLEFSGGVFYTRHKTLDPNHALTNDQNQGVERILNAMMPTVFRHYERYLNGQWGQVVTHPGNPQQTDEIHRILRELQCQALNHEIELNVLTRAMSLSDSTRLSSVIAGESSDGVYNVSYVAPNGFRVDMASTYVVTQSPESTDESSGIVFLVMPCKGIERFESLNALREALSLRLCGEDRDPHLVAAMPLSDQGRWSADRPVGADAWRFQSVSTSLMNEHLQWVYMKQIQDFAYLVEQPALDVASWHRDVDRVQSCAHLDDAMGHRFNLLSVGTSEYVAPDWRKFANPTDKAHLLDLEHRYRTHKSQVAKRLSGVESLTGFAYDQITAYIQNHLGCLIDPNEVMITLDDTIQLSNDEQLSAKYEKTLLEFAVTGLPSTLGQMSFAPSANHLHTDFSPAFIETMMKDLNLHHRYAAALRQAYEDEESVRQRVIHRDSLIALGAFAARLKGHLVQDRSHELLSNIRGDKHKDGSTYSLGSLYLKETDTRFNDVIVFAEKTQVEEHFVLYAPGAPGGRDFFEFGSLRQLCFEVGAWLGSEAGRSYVHSQLTGPMETGHAAVIDRIYTNPSLQGADMCVFVSCQASTFEDNLADLVSQKASRTLQAAERVAPYKDSQDSFASLAVQAQLSARIDALNAEFIRISPDLIDFRTFAQEKISIALNKRLHKDKFLQSEMSGLHIDPATLYLGLGEPHTTHPDFSQLHPLTDLVMEGRQNIDSYRPLAYGYSSTGTCSHVLLSRRFIDIAHELVSELDVCTQYMNFLKQNFLSRKAPLYARRKLLMASRIEHEIRRAALKAFVHGNLSENQYSWLGRTSRGLNHDLKGLQSTTAQTGVCAFQIDGQIVEGVYIFRDFNKTDPDFNLLYTPEAPDGMSFRPLSDYATLLSSPQMQNYFYDRVAFSGRPRVNAFIDELVRGKKNDADFIRIVNRKGKGIPQGSQLYGEMIERIILDVDAQTTSRSETRIATTWSMIQFLGDVLLLPFPAAAIAWGIFTSAVEIYQGVEAYMSGDRIAALPQVLMGVYGVVSGVHSARNLHAAVKLASKGVGAPVGMWVWHTLEFESKVPEAVSEFFQKEAKSLISEQF